MKYFRTKAQPTLKEKVAFRKLLPKQKLAFKNEARYIFRVILKASRKSSNQTKL